MSNSLPSLAIEGQGDANIGRAIGNARSDASEVIDLHAAQRYVTNIAYQLGIPLSELEEGWAILYDDGTRWIDQEKPEAITVLANAAGRHVAVVIQALPEATTDYVSIVVHLSSGPIPPIQFMATIDRATGDVTDEALGLSIPNPEGGIQRTFHTVDDGYYARAHVTTPFEGIKGEVGVGREYRQVKD